MNEINHHYLYVPSEDFNSKSCLISSLLFKNGEAVKIDDLLLVVETSKKTIEIHAPISGFFYYIVEENIEINIQNAIAIISTALLTDKTLQKLLIKKETNSMARISSKATKYLEKYNVDPSNFKDLEDVKIEDVKKYLKEVNFLETTDYLTRKTLMEENLSPNLYTCYVSTFFRFDKLLAKLKEKTSELKKNITVDVLFIYYVHETLKDFSKLSSYIDETELVKLTHCPVGIYVSDKGKQGISFVLTKDNLRDMSNTADTIYEIYKTYLTNSGTDKGVMQAAFYISNMMNLNVSNFVPMLKKRTGATLGISSPDHLGYFNVGLTFDHRITEGSYVATFLNELKKKIEN